MDNKTEDIKKLVADAQKKAQESPDKEQVKKMVTEAVAKGKRQKGAWVADDDADAGGIDISKSSADPKVKDFQKRSDDVYLMSKILRQDAKTLRIYKNFEESELAKAMAAATSGSGLEWVPTAFSADLIDKVRLALKVAALHKRIDMPTNPYKLPVVSSDATAYLISEATSDTETKITASTPGTKNVTLTAIKLAGRVLFSEELTEDSIIPVLGFVKSNISTALAVAQEDATINGDTSGTHQDSDVTSANDARKAYNGYRKLALSGAKVDCSSFTIDNLRSIRKAMGKYGVDPSKLAWVTGISVYSQLLSLKDSSGNPMVITVDKYGPNATIMTGELAKVDGCPVIVSEKIREDLNDSGVYDGSTTTKTLICLVYVPGFVYGDRRRVTIKTKEEIETDQQLLVATQRLDFEDVIDASTEKIVGLGYNITS